MLKQLTGLDASFLYMETATSFGHISGLSIFEHPGGAYDPYEAFKRQLESRLTDLEPLQRRLVEVPFSLDHPFWIIDPDFDIEFHVRHLSVPPPGTAEQLATQVARLIGRPMDRTRPLWEAYVIEGLEGNRFATLTKIHHATVDGAAGAQLLGMLLDTDPDARPAPGDDSWPTDRLPSDVEMTARALANLARRPEKILRWQVRTARQVAAATRSVGLANLIDAAVSTLPGPRGRRDDGDAPPPLPSLAAPATPFNRSITAHRRFAFRSVPLERVKTVKNALGATLNDVVMAACAGALRRYLQAHDALPDRALVSMIPVSVRTGAEDDPWTNRVSGIIASLPTDEDDPLVRVRKVNEIMAAAKERFDLLPADTLVDLAELAPPALFTRAARMATRMRIADRMNPPVNLIVSNVPGPRVPLYLGGAKLLNYYPVSTIAEGQGLNITVHSYLDHLDFGLVACRELVPDLWDLVDLCVDELDVLATAAGVAGTAAGEAARKPARRAAR